MGKIKGQKEWAKFVNGEELTRKEAIFAKCYECNGFDESRDDCMGGISCPLYHWSPHAKQIDSTSLKRRLDRFSAPNYRGMSKLGDNI